jgi:ribokinase
MPSSVPYDACSPDAPSSLSGILGPVTTHVVVVGSINVDLVVAADRLPRPGETVLGGRFAEHQGGRDAKRAVAEARAGATVTLVGAVGDDRHGEVALAALNAEGIDTSRVRVVPGEPTGVALIAVGPRGENQIVVAPGANASLVPGDVHQLPLVRGDALLTNLEIPMPTVSAALQAARDIGATAVLNPAPAHALPADVLALGPILTPNEHELVVAIGNDDPAAALNELSARTEGPIVVTQGPAGALLARGRRRDRFDGFLAPLLTDTTGAGDAFCGVLATWLAEGHPLEEAIVAANAAGALTVGGAGAREGMPVRSAILAILDDRGA